MSSDKLVCVTGGMGSGKSLVADMLRTMGYPVYDCDTRAKAIMDSDRSVAAALVEAFGHETFSGGRLDSAYLGGLVFSDPTRLARLNGIVHPAVREDLAAWRSEFPGLKFVESAIPFQSGLDKVVDALWLCRAPEQVRIRRVQSRDGLSRERILERMASGAPFESYMQRFAAVIVNDGRHGVLPQLLALLSGLRES